MSIQLPDLPYDFDALAPHISGETLKFHYGKHHAGYLKKLNAAIAGTSYEGHDLPAIIRKAHSDGDTGVFNNSAQAWNHDFLWHSMSPNGGGEPGGKLAEALAAAFGNLAGFREQFKKAALGQFGSGWTWLVEKSGELEIVSTANADTPVAGEATPLITLDVWEHAYYLDYQNQRDRYVDAFLQDLINWDFAAQNLKADRAAA